jgi:hypothetical protein
VIKVSSRVTNQIFWVADTTTTLRLSISSKFLWLIEMIKDQLSNAVRIICRVGHSVPDLWQLAAPLGICELMGFLLANALPLPFYIFIFRFLCYRIQLD